MPKALCVVPAAPVRREPSHRSEMTTQLLFGESMDVLQEEGEWLHVRAHDDGYEGWITHHLVSRSTEVQNLAPARFAATDLVNILEWKGNPVQVPMGSSLPGYDVPTKLLWDGISVYAGPYRDMTVPDPALIAPAALRWRNAPYLWGGKTLMGVDCSGFVQTVFKVAGVRLPRDAWQQAGQGRLVESLAEVMRGDLAFFHNEQGRVIHVGLLLEDSHIIHASGQVRIDRLDEKGIWNGEQDRYTHQLHSIRRFFGPATL